MKLNVQMTDVVHRTNPPFWNKYKWKLKAAWWCLTKPAFSVMKFEKNGKGVDMELYYTGVTSEFIGEVLQKSGTVFIQSDKNLKAANDILNSFEKEKGD